MYCPGSYCIKTVSYRRYLDGVLWHLMFRCGNFQAEAGLHTVTAGHIINIDEERIPP